MAQTLFIQDKKISVDTELITQFQEQGYTILHCETCSGVERVPEGTLTIQWTTVTKTASIIHRPTQEKLPLLHAINIPVNPEKYWFKFFGECLKFTLIYPQIPSNWSYFDFVGDPTSVTKIPKGHIVTGWVVRNIRRNKTGVYRLKL